MIDESQGRRQGKSRKRARELDGRSEGEMEWEGKRLEGVVWPRDRKGGSPGSDDYNKCHGIYHLCRRKGGGRLGARRLALPPPLVRAPFGSHCATDDTWANNGGVHCICYRVIRESGRSSR